MSWFAKGNDSRASDLMNIGRESKSWRFWVKKGESAEIIFLDDPQFLITEYSFKIGDSYQNYTCAGETCPALLRGYKPYPAQLYTVLDLTPWKDKEGKEHKFTKKVLVVKGKKSMELLDHQRQAAKGSLIGVKMKMIRTNADKSSNIGDSFVISGKVKLDTLSESDRAPVDYEQEFAPPTESKMIQILKVAAPVVDGKKKAATVSREAYGDSSVGAAAPSGSFDASEEIPW